MSGKTDFFGASYYNPVTYLSNFNYTADLSILPQSFGIDKLSPMRLTLSLPLDSSFRLIPSTSGIFNNLYRQNQFALDAAYNITNFFAFSAGYSYNIFEIKDVEKYEYTAVRANSLISFTQNISLGLGINLEKYSENEFELSSSSLGICYEVDDDFAFDISGYFYNNFPSSIIVSSKLNIIEDLNIRLAYKINPNTISGGISYNFIDNFSLFYILERHYYLGFSHYINLRFEL